MIWRLQPGPVNSECDYAVARWGRLAAFPGRSVSGDLLEEYRESVVPALGHYANGWYLRQVAGYVLRKAWLGGVLVGAILVTRYLVDMLAPVRYTPGVVHPRSAITSYALMATFALGVGWQAWRSGRVGTGVLVAFATAAFGGALSAAGTVHSSPS